MSDQREDLVTDVYDNANSNTHNQFDELNSKLIKRVSADPQAEKYREIYRSYQIPVDMKEQELDKVPRAATKEAAIVKTAEALKVVVGRILLEASRQQ